MLPSVHERRHGYVPAGFYCLVRGGGIARVPHGPCVVEKGERNAAICWESPIGTQRVEMPIERLDELIGSGRLRIDAVELDR